MVSLEKWMILFLKITERVLTFLDKQVFNEGLNDSNDGHISQD